MTDYEKPTERPAVGHFLGYDHIHIWSLNAKQVASYYSIRFGFDIVAYKGLETGHRDVATYVLRKNNITIAISSPLNPVDNEISQQVAICGDFVSDVAFEVADCEALYEKAVERGAVSVSAPETLTEEGVEGSVIVATIKTYGNVNHTFVQRNGYAGTFLPGYKTITDVDPVQKHLPDTGLQLIDHVVGNQPDDEMEPVVEWYVRILDFHRFWSVDDKQINTEYSSLRSVVVTDFDEKVKMPINEPAVGLRKSQIQEYIDYHGTGGVQHVAFKTDDIIASVSALRERGVEFLTIPDTYYDTLRIRLKKSPVQIIQSLDDIQRLGLLVDYDEKGYLLQLFTKPVQPRPSLFYEIIYRNNHDGFGAGNFKSLFEAIELEQGNRGNL